MYSSRVLQEEDVCPGPIENSGERHPVVEREVHDPVGGAHRDTVDTCTVTVPQEIDGVPPGPGPPFVKIHRAEVGPAEEDELPGMVVECYRELVRILGVHFPDPPSGNAGIERGNKK